MRSEDQRNVFTDQSEVNSRKKINDGDLTAKPEGPALGNENAMSYAPA